MDIVLDINYLGSIHHQTIKKKCLNMMKKKKKWQLVIIWNKYAL